MRCIPPLLIVLLGLAAVPPATASDGYWTAARRAAADRAAGTERSWRSYPADAVLANTELLGVRLTGRVYSVRPDGTPYSCSATVVASANRSVVWTAGHCLNGGRGSTAHTQITFYPAIRPGANPGGDAPYGAWTAIAAQTTADWAREGSRRRFRRDVGGFVVGRNTAGATITDVLGGAHAIAFGRRHGRFSVTGYPGAGRFVGNVAPWTCPPRPVGRYTRVRGAGPPPLVVRCELTAGTSGGPWLDAVGPDGIGTVVSVQSSGWPEKGTGYGPVLDRSAERVFRALEQIPA